MRQEYAGQQNNRGKVKVSPKQSLVSPWLFRPSPKPDATFRLFCFPYAGAGASAYRLWPNHLPTSVELCAVQTPGRESRLRERPFTSFRDLIEAAVDGLEPSCDRPFAFFGHSMGSLVAFEVARALVARGNTPPVHLFVSGQRAPHLLRTTPR